MGAQINQRDGCLEVPAIVGGVSEVAAVYRALAERCVRERFARVLVTTIDNDSVTERALRNAFSTMLLAGIPPAFRMALVAATPQIEARYRSLRSDLRYLAIEMEFFSSEDEAARWLHRPTRVAA